MRPEFQGFARIANHQDGLRQDTEEGYWFGSGIQSGMIAARDLRMIAVSTDNPEETDLTCFGPGPLLRSVYQQLTIGRDCDIGVVEVDFYHPPTQPLSEAQKFAQISIYDDDGVAGIPLTLLGRCIPVPLSFLTHVNTQRLIIPLWAPIAVSSGDVIWVGVSPKIYLGPGEAPPYGPIDQLTTFVNSRGNRDVLLADDFIKSQDTEPPLVAPFTSHNDRRIFVRIYEPPENIPMSAPANAGAPRAAVGFRSIIARPQEGQIASAYAGGIRPGHGTQPWNAGGYYSLGGVGTPAVRTFPPGAVIYANAAGALTGVVAEMSWAAGVLLVNGDLALGQAGVNTFRANTADAADTAVIYVTGGGAVGTTRGGTMGICGNEYAAGYRGLIILQAGNPGTTGTYDGMIRFDSGGGLAATFTRERDLFLYYNLYSDEVASGNTNSFQAFVSPGASITLGSDKLGASFIAPWDMTIVRCSAHAQVAPVGADIIFDINKNGVTIWTVQANRLKILNGANSGNTSTFSVTAVAQGDKITFDVDQRGVATVGANVTVEITFVKQALI